MTIENFKSQTELSTAVSKLEKDISSVRVEVDEEIGKMKEAIRSMRRRLIKHTILAAIIQYILLIGSIAALLRYAGILK